jgi:hypothetical protein
LTASNATLSAKPLVVWSSLSTLARKMCEMCSDEVKRLSEAILSEFDHKNIDEGTAFFAVQRILLIMLTEDFEKEEFDKNFIPYFRNCFLLIKNQSAEI